MSTLSERLDRDLKEAMKARDERALGVLRMVRAEAQKLRADRGVDATVTDEDLQAICRHQIKTRREAADQYAKGGSSDRAEAELAEAKLLEVYLPSQLSDEELEELVRQKRDQLSNPSPKDLGRMMGLVMPAVAGRADGDRVRACVTRLLAE